MAGSDIKARRLQVLLSLAPVLTHFFWNQADGEGITSFNLWRCNWDLLTGVGQFYAPKVGQVLTSIDSGHSIELFISHRLLHELQIKFIKLRWKVLSLTRPAP